MSKINNNLIHTASDRTPYTYLIGWKSLDKWYYGVRYGKGVHPSDLWNTYFTSSKHVKKFREINGEPDVVIIRKTFETINSARDWEDKVIDRMGMVHSEKFINMGNSKSIHPNASALHRLGKTYEELYGTEKSLQIKSLLSKTSIIANAYLKPWSERKGDREHGNTGKKLSDVHKEKISKTVTTYMSTDERREQIRISTTKIMSTDEKRQEMSEQFTRLWTELDFQIKVAQSRGTHYTALKTCPECNNLFGGSPKTKAFHKKIYCSHLCSNKNKRCVLPYICTSPEGVSEITNDLKQFCIDNLLVFSAFKASIKEKTTQYEGWTGRLAENPNIN